MSTFFSFIFKENLLHTLLFLFTFLFLLTLIMGTLNLSEALELNPSFPFVLKTYLLTSLQLLSFLLPLSSFLGVLFTFQRLKEERELLALFSLGYTLKDLLKPLSLFLLLFFLLTFLSHFYLLPLSKRVIKEEKIRLAEGLFQGEIPLKRPFPLTKDFYLYVKDSQKVDSQNHLKGVLLLQRRSQESRGVYLAKQGLLDLKSGSFHLKEGYLFLLEKYQISEILKFKTYDFRVELKELQRRDYYIKRGEMTLSELKAELKNLKPPSEKYFRYLSEYYHRLLYALSTFPLLFQALLLSLLLKPQTRFILFLLGLAFYLAFYFLYNFFISLGETGKIFPLYSHLLFHLLFTGLLLLEYQLLKKRGLAFS